MIDIRTEITSILTAATSVPVYYELLYKKGSVPSITYIEVDNADLLNGDKHNYSTLRYEIKIWATELSDIISLSILVDTAMKAAGWSRYTAFETTNETIITKVLRYVATGYNEV